MEKEQRTRLQKATQDARKLLEEEFSSQLLQTYDIDVDKVRWAEEPGAHLLAEQRLIREKLIAWIEHKEAQINDRKEALLLALREMAFTALNRFVALKLMEARELVRPCVTGGLESAGFLEFTAVAQGLLADQESSYRLYLETIFEDVSRELRALFDPRDPASLLWPKRTALLELLDILNRPELAALWSEDETLGWVYQYFNGDAERKKMREESAAPRNSRELAVRNQFFTPRYVVEFLTDNTLGRIWYEMRQGNTGLNERCRYLVRRPNEVWLQRGEEPPAQQDTDEALSQEDLLRHPVQIPYRPLKDPREIRMLDPACGSMHFGLYAFDLYLVIYGEAWEIAQGSDQQAEQADAFSSFVAYAAGFETKNHFLREVPRLILQHNIHGIDIDPRAAQIAQFTLWLRAQRAWQDQRVVVAERPAILRSNVVCAEPMPGERDLLADFVDQQFPDAERGIVQRLLERIFNKMGTAGEAGSLLEIEEEIRDAIEDARRDWQRLAIRQGDIFSADDLAELGDLGRSMSNDLQNITKDFWKNIEDRIYEALRIYAKQAESRGGFHRGLFAEDVSQGFAFIDACRKQYDLALMNPPFGELPKGIDVKSISPELRDANDAYCWFAARVKALAPDGLVGIISNSSFVLYETFSAFRRKMLGEWRLHSLISLGDGVLDGAWVSTAAYVYSMAPQKGDIAITFVDARSAPDKGSLVSSSISSILRCSPTKEVALRKSSTFSRIPGSPMCHWASDSLWRIAEENAPFDTLLEDAGVGAAPVADFFRLRWEIPSELISLDKRWVPYANAGHFSPFYRDDYLCVDWENDGAKPKADLCFRYPYLNGNVGIRIQRTSRYGSTGLTSGVRSDRFNAQILPSGMLFGFNGLGIFGRQEYSPFLLLVLLNQRFTAFYLNLITGLKKNDVYIRRIPVPDLGIEAKERLEEIGKRLWHAMRLAASDVETSNFFYVPPILRVKKDSLREATIAWRASDREEEVRFAKDLYESEALLAEALGIDSDLEKFIHEDQGPCYWLLPEKELSEGLDIEAIIDKGSDSKTRGLFCRDDGKAGTDLALLSLGACVHPSIVASRLNEIRFVSRAELSYQARTVLSYALGCAFGRWDIRHASGAYVPPSLNEPLAPLPPCPPGSLAGEDGLQISIDDALALRSSGDYPLDIALNGLLADISLDSLDLLDYIGSAFRCIWGDASSAIEVELCHLLGISTLREWFRNPSGFFADHLKRYSKSRRQAPIYWQLSVGDGFYSVWIYYHRLTQDTLYRVLRDFVEPGIQQAEREQFELESQGALSGDTATRLQAAQNLLQGLRLLKNELDLVAPLWNPNLNDGVIINHAILWRITPYVPWQKKCKECWNKLEKGEYEWAHLAFHLWPERVIPKCTTDRSLAIAHGLEERLWQETNNGNWLPRQLNEADLQALIAEHTNPAVKNALERVLAAPPPVAPTRTRASRSTRSSGSSAPRRPRGTAAVVDAEATRQVLLALTAAPSDGLAKAAIADLIGVETNAITAVIKQLKESGQIDQLGERRGARYVLSEQGRAAVASEHEVEA
jgi:type I restriction-modification system DNA methylase subunit